MGESFLIKKGDYSDQRIFARIGVTYPEGSTCTCSNGTKTLKDDSTSGTVIFNIPEAGSWTVTATQGSTTTSKSVNITSKGQVEIIILSYDLTLFSNGSLASGYSLSGTYISPAVDVSDYSSLEITCVANIGDYFFVGLCSNPSGVSMTAPPAAYVVVPTTEGTVSIDLNNLSGKMYLCGWWSVVYSATPASVSGNKLVFTCPQSSVYTANLSSIIFKP